MSLKHYFESNFQLVFLRLTVDKTLNEIFNIMIETPRTIKIIVSEEESKQQKKHFHILIITDDSNQKNAKQNIKNYINKALSINGNAEYAITETRRGTEKRIATYVVKDGKFMFNGFSNDEIRMFVKLSYTKYDPKQFMLDREELIEEFLRDESNTDTEKLCINYANLKTKYRQRHTMSTMESDIRLINDIKYPGTTGANLFRKIFLQ